MSTIEISLRLSGNLPPADELGQRLKMQPTKSLRRGEKVSQKRIQPVDVWLLDLAEYDSDRPQSEIDQQLVELSAVIAQMAPGLSALDRTQCHADLYISTIREEDQGGLSLPPELIAATAAANLSIQLSILVSLTDEDSAPSDVSEPNPSTRRLYNNQLALDRTDLVLDGTNSVTQTSREIQ